MIKVGCKILLKKEVLDTKGRALLKLLQKEDSSVKDCHYGKYIELNIDTKDSQQALKQAKLLAQKILHNDLIESFELEIIN
ncbi:MAG: phosphoribosylformylglycinamidine synthase subunit PurS [Oligoflexia bacterium]|nr:phosphoribosylformylglycinamidine synthase subunit PurS [Oligoflexia bacterium]